MRFEAADAAAGVKAEVERLGAARVMHQIYNEASALVCVSRCTLAVLEMPSAYVAEEHSAGA